MKKYMDGTTSSSLFEARLGHEKFGKEVHAYSVAFSEEDIQAVKPFAAHDRLDRIRNNLT